MKSKSKQSVKKVGVRKDQARIVSEEIDKMQDDMQKALTLNSDETKKTVVKLVRSRRETRINFVFKGNPDDTEERLQRVHKAVTK